jgi:hypothetical protein
MYSKKNKKNDTDLIAERITEFFLEYWKKQDNRDNETAVLHSGSLLEEACPVVKSAT